MVAIVVPDIEVAHRILLLNTEKAHNLRERSLEVIRLAELLAAAESRPENEYEIEFEEPALLTLGLCYQQNGRFAGGAYHPILRRIEQWEAAALPAALETRRERAARILELDAAVTEAMTGAQIARIREPLPAAVRGRQNQPHPLQARRRGCRRGDRHDAGLGPKVRRRQGAGGPGGQGGGCA